MSDATLSRVALITGAGTGIGKAVAQALAQEGFLTILAGRRAQPLEFAVAELSHVGGRAVAETVDVSDPESVRSLFTRIHDRFARLDLLFNNAGTSTRAVPMDELTAAEWLQVIDVNLTGAFLCTQQAMRLMKVQRPQGGRIINNGSISAHTPRLYSAPYTASKHGLLGLTKATALEGRPFGIACGQIDIGNASTAIGAQPAGGALQADGSTRVEPMMSLEHVAAAVRYMASLPLESNVLNLTVMATGMPFVGRG
jgi:NAD(P)-dependent dehydrogenase (short-subunit alcohol dehydrogenase family)